MAENFDPHQSDNEEEGDQNNFGGYSTTPPGDTVSPELRVNGTETHENRNGQSNTYSLFPEINNGPSSSSASHSYNGGRAGVIASSVEGRSLGPLPMARGNGPSSYQNVPGIMSRSLQASQNIPEPMAHGNNTPGVIGGRHTGAIPKSRRNGGSQAPPSIFQARETLDPIDGTAAGFRNGFSRNRTISTGSQQFDDLRPRMESSFANPFNSHHTRTNGSASMNSSLIPKSPLPFEQQTSQMPPVTDCDLMNQFGNMSMSNLSSINGLNSTSTSTYYDACATADIEYAGDGQVPLFPNHLLSPTPRPAPCSNRNTPTGFDRNDNLYGNRSYNYDPPNLNHRMNNPSEQNVPNLGPVIRLFKDNSCSTTQQPRSLPFNHHNSSMRNATMPLTNGSTLRPCGVCSSVAVTRFCTFCKKNYCRNCTECTSSGNRLHSNDCVNFLPIQNNGVRPPFRSSTPHPWQSPPAMSNHGGMSMSLNTSRLSAISGCSSIPPYGYPRYPGNAPERNRYCQTHPGYFSRYYDSAAIEWVCVVCTLKHVGKKPPLRKPEIIYFRDMTVVDQFVRAVNMFSAQVDELPKLINRFVNDNIHVFENDSSANHDVFRTNIIFDRITNPAQQNEYTEILKMVNSVMRNISNIFDPVDIHRMLGLLRMCGERIEDMEKKSTGPSAIAIKADDPLAGVGSNSIVSGPAKQSGCARVGDESFFYLEVRDCTGRPRDDKIDAVNINIREIRTNTQVRVKYEKTHLFGCTRVVFYFQAAGNYLVNVTVNNEVVYGTPFTVEAIDREICYKAFYEAHAHIGISELPNSSGSENRFFMRPWGFYVCKRTGKYVIADRGQHRIVILSSSGAFEFMFGSQGVNDGQFNRPSKALIMESEDGLGNEILVCDKDNNRLQVFNMRGEFLRKTVAFLPKREDVLFYPWDSCVTHYGLIITTDTRKFRLVIHNKSLQYLGQLPFLDAKMPRGICAGYLNQVLVTEFTRSEILVINVPSQFYRQKNKEQMIERAYDMKVYPNDRFEKMDRFRTTEKNAERLQGIDMDKFGNILVADSRQNRIRCVNYYGKEFCSFEVNGLPQGVSLGSDRVCVANNCKNTIDVYNFRVL